MKRLIFEIVEHSLPQVETDAVDCNDHKCVDMIDLVIKNVRKMFCSPWL